jgi:primary-amine oxidase
MAVVDVTDHGVVPLPPRSGNYYPELMTAAGNVPDFDKPRQPLRPISITQPDGPSFEVDGHAVAWANWRLRIGFTPREGLVLHDLNYLDKGVSRSVLYRASLAEMYVPYGDPSETHWNKNVFDEGEYGLGWLVPRSSAHSSLPACSRPTTSTTSAFAWTCASTPTETTSLS